MLNLFNNHTKSRSEKIANRIFPYIKQSKKIVDIGSGTGAIALALQERDKKITPVDVKDYRWPRLLKPIIYNGVKLPFPNNSFDTALLLMVMHHTPNASIVFLEAARVAKNIVVIETSYKNKLEKLITVTLDTIGNLQTNVYWESYKSDFEWKNFFKKYGFTIKAVQYHDDGKYGIPFLHILYSLTKAT